MIQYFLLFFRHAWIITVFYKINVICFNITLSIIFGDMHAWIITVL